jgi:DNA processing protein
MSSSNTLPDRAARAVLADLFSPLNAEIGALIQHLGAAEALKCILAAESSPELSPGLAKRAACARDLAGLASAADALAHAGRLEDEARACGAHVIVPGDPTWPSGLDQLTPHLCAVAPWSAPWCLWAKGNLTQIPQTGRLVGFWGHRVGSDTGDGFAAEAGEQVTRAGYTVVTVGETGIASAAHRGGLRLGPTITIVAGGLDGPEPVGNRALFDDIAEQGLLISAQPPGRRADILSTAARDAMLAAACGALAFIEAPYRAAEQPVFNLARALDRTIVSSWSRDAAHRRIGNRRLEHCGAVGVRGATELVAQVSADRWKK